MRRNCGERVSGRSNSLCKGPGAETSLGLRGAERKPIHGGGGEGGGGGAGGEGGPEGWGREQQGRGRGREGTLGGGGGEGGWCEPGRLSVPEGEAGRWAG